MTQSDSYYDAAAQEEDFTDSVILRPISLKPTVVPQILGRNNPENTILAAYDKIKLTEYIESSEQGYVIQLISLQQKSHLTILSSQGNQFLQRFSGSDIAFVMVTGQQGSGKSFFIDKILNLSNIQGNNFSMSSNRPAINVWSTPFIKEDLRFFIAQVSGCSPGSKQFDMLLPYVTILSSVIVNFQEFKQKAASRSYSKLDQKLNNFLDQFISQKMSQKDNKNEVMNNIFPKIIYKVQRSKNQAAYFSQRSQLRSQQFYLPNAKNPQYRGIDEDLRIHSFLNKKCVNEQYIHKTSQFFNKIYAQVQQKKHRQLVFNGGIILKYLHELSLLFHKNRKIDMGQVYYDIVKDLYISAYNYCVICYHQSLEGALSDQKPRSLQELIQIFEKASNQILQKYNQFSLQKSLHQEYEEKLQKHIESKQRLLLQINKKKTQIQLRKLYDESVNLNDLNKIWSQINLINQNNPTFTHGRDQIMGKKLSEVITKLSNGNNVDYILKKQIQKISQQIKDKKQQLSSIKQFNKKSKNQNDEKQRIGQQQQASLLSQNNQIDQAIRKLKKQIQLYQNIDLADPGKLKIQEASQLSKFQKNEKKLQQLKIEDTNPIENTNSIRELRNRIDDVKNKYLSQQLTLKQIQGNINGNQPIQGDQSNIKMKKQNSNVGQKNVQSKKQVIVNQVNKSNSELKGMNESKSNKKGSK